MIPINSTTYYDPKPNRAISEFIDSVVNLPVHPEDELLHPVKEMQEWLAITIKWNRIWDVIRVWRCW